jgi:hypothetical protein
MSMINDALRRASSAARRTSSPSPNPAAEPAAPPPPMPSAASAFPPPPPLAIPDSALPPSLVDEEPAHPRGNKVQLILAVILVLAVGIVAAVNFWEKKNQTPVAVSANEGRKSILPDASSIRTATETLSAVTNRAARAEQAFPTPPAAAPVAASTSKPAPVVPVVAAPNSPPPKFPLLRLQSIYYRPSNPSVMINGRTLYVDDEIQGVKVADIQPANVTLVLSGYTIVLTLR